MHQTTKIGIGREATLPVAMGDLVAGKYRVDSVLAVGGMGVVVRATHIALHRPVALKFVLPSLVESPEVRQRLMLEARAAARLRSEHVARVLDVGEHAERIPFIVMEYLEGEDLASLLSVGGPLRVHVAVSWVLQVCDAVAEAHAAGIVHRDLKPENVFVTTTSHGTPLIKVLDFGISKLVASGAQGATVADRPMLLGSPMYMSPEQMLDPASVDTRTDVWALGVLLYELLSGVSPFASDTLPEICARVLDASPVRLGHLVRAVPPGLEAAVHRCLAKDREHRFGTVHELARAIAPYAVEAGRAEAAPSTTTTATAPSLAPASMDLVDDDDDMPTLVELEDPSVARFEQRLKRSSRRTHRAFVFLGAVAIIAIGSTLAMQQIGPNDVQAFAERIEELARPDPPRADPPAATTTPAPVTPPPSRRVDSVTPPSAQPTPAAPTVGAPSGPPRASAAPSNAAPARGKARSRPNARPPAVAPPSEVTPERDPYRDPPGPPAPEPPSSEPYDEAPGAPPPPPPSAPPGDGVYDSRF